jgi:hypothetical protein
MIARLLEKPVPTLADPFPFDDPPPGAYELHLPAGNVTIWYTVLPYQRRSHLYPDSADHLIAANIDHDRATGTPRPAWLASGLVQEGPELRSQVRIQFDGPQQV